MPYCIKCGSELKADQKFCMKCGAPVSSSSNPMISSQPKTQPKSKCSNCGKDLKPSDKFCINCGKPVQFSNRAQANGQLSLGHQQQIQVPLHGDKGKSKKKIILISAISLALVAIIAVSGFMLLPELIANNNTDEASGSVSTTSESNSKTNSNITLTEPQTQPSTAPQTEPPTEPPTEAPTNPDYYDQKVEVVSSGTNATLTLYEWQEGEWKELMSTNATVGQNGVGTNYGEGTKITPEGTFDLGFCYGLTQPDTKLEFVELEYGSIFVSDSTSPYYNCLTSKANFSGANIEDTYTQFAEQNKYNYNIFIEHNGDGKTPGSATPGMGSVITICGYNGTLKPTWGCVDISTSAMTELLSYLDSDKNPVIIIS